MHAARRNSCVRYDAWTEEWLLFCQACADEGHRRVFWPLDTEYWDPTNMSACRKCLKRQAAAAIRHRRRTDPAFKAAQDAASKANRRAKLTIYQRNHRNRKRGVREPWQPNRQPNISPRPSITILATTSPQRASAPIHGPATTATPATTTALTPRAASADTAETVSIAAQSMRRIRSQTAASAGTSPAAHSALASSTASPR